MSFEYKYKHLSIVIPEANQGGFNRSEFNRLLRERLVGQFLAQFPDYEDEVDKALNYNYSPWGHLDDLEANRQVFNRVMSYDIIYLNVYLN